MKTSKINSNSPMRGTGSGLKMIKAALLVTLVFFLTGMQFSYAGNSGDATVEDNNGLKTTKFKTIEGIVTVYLPSDIRAGESISGTVVAEAKGKNDNQIKKNQATLEGYVIDFAEKETKTGKNKEKWMIPAGLAGGITYLVLKDAKGKVIGSMDIPVSKPGFTAFNSGKEIMDIPPVMNSATPVSISGPFDGDFENTLVSLDGKPVCILAESEHGIFCEVPGDINPGPADLTISENGVITNETINVLDLSLSADRVNLQRGESARLEVTVRGLDGLEVPVQVEIVNVTPQVIQITGGSSQIININPDMVNSSGTYSYTFQATALNTGGFSVGAQILGSSESNIQNEDETQFGDDIDYDDITERDDLPALIKPGYDRYSLARANGKSHEKAMDEAFSSEKAKKRWTDIFKRIYGK